MKRKMLAIFVAMGMVTGLLAGCSGGTAGSEPATQGETSTQKTDASADKQTETSGSAAEDGEIPTITIYNNSGAMVAGADGTGISSEEDYKMVQDYILEHTGVRVEIISPIGADESKLATLISSNQIDGWWGDWSSYADDGIIMQLNDWKDVIEKYYGDDMVKNMSDADGNLWGLGRNVSATYYPVFVRNDWLDQMGMDMPETIDDLNAYLYMVKEQDPFGNGETIPLLAHSVDDLENTFLGGYVAGGTDYWLDETDGKLKLYWMADGYKDFLAQAHQWYEDGILHPEFLTFEDPGDMREYVAQGRVAATACWYSRITGVEETTAKNVNLDASKWTYTFGWNSKGITGPNGQPGQTLSLGGRTGLLISSRCEHPEAFFKVLDWALSPVGEEDAVPNMPEYATYYNLFRDGMVGKVWEYAEGEDGEIGTAFIPGQSQHATDFAIFDGSLVSLRPASKIKYANGVWDMHDFFWGWSGTEYDTGGTARSTPCVVPEIKQTTIILNTALSATSAVGDVKTYRTEEMAKFLKGERDLDTYDQFIEECYEIGLDEMIDSYTEQYNAQH